MYKSVPGPRSEMASIFIMHIFNFMYTAKLFLKLPVYIFPAMHELTHMAQGVVYLQSWQH